ncbi:MAG: hypothetical protein J7M24_05380 [Candidatus Latescibacteria bacterium]|nr:hypothetical protein [Candidatus Latescibacterota bacterium]
MRKWTGAILAAAVLSAAPHGVYAQKADPAETNMEGSYWKHKTSQFRTLPNPVGEICFLGDSITDGCEWRELTGCNRVTNRGIGGDTAWGLMARIDEVTEGKPAKVFLMIGTNDLAWGGKEPPEVADRIADVLDAIRRDSPGTTVYLQSVLPVIDGRVKKFENRKITALNKLLKPLAARKGATWVNLVPFFRDDESGQLKKNYTEDGLHLTGEAYYQWLSVIRGYLP